MRVLIVDTETGGLNSDKYSLLSVAAVVIDLENPTFEVLDQWEAYHRLGSIEAYKTSAEALAVNKLILQDVFDSGISSEDLANKLIDTWNRLACTAIGGQNWPFDRGFLAKRLFHVTEPELENIFSSQGRFTVLDTLCIARMLTGLLSVKSMSLGNLVKAFGADNKADKSKYHGAKFDSLQTAKLLYTQKEMFANGYKASSSK